VNSLEVASLTSKIIAGAARLGDHAQEQAQYAQALMEAVTRDESRLPYTDRIAEMPVNKKPFNRDFVRNFPGSTFWPLRKPESVTGITIHHTLSHSPLATARYCTQTKGYPTIQYHAWISAGDGCPVWMLADPAWGLWHDHTGKFQHTISIGMAGSLHLKAPPVEQMEATARLIVHLMGEYSIPIRQVQGHNERYGKNKYGRWRTQCPGWYDVKWRAAFFDVLKGMLKE